ncbi:MAG: permease [Sphingobacteriales bacterium]|nr:MAG: permease [Sphingobacteriales bacterium]
MKKHTHLLAILSAGTLWAFMVFPLRALKLYSAYQILNARIMVAFLMVWLIILLFKRQKVKKNFLDLASLKNTHRNKILFLIVLSGVLITINWLVFIYVINHVNLKSGAFAYILCPLITAFGGRVLLGESLSKIKYIALTLALLGVLGLATASIYEIMWSFFIALTYALFLIIQSVIKQIDKLVMLGLQLFISLLLLLPFYILQQEVVPFEVAFWANVSIIAFFFTIVPLLLSLYALEGLPSSTIGVSIYINPFISILIATLYYHEEIKSEQVVFYCLLFFAVLLFNRDIILGIFIAKKKNNNTPKLA